MMIIKIDNKTAVLKKNTSIDLILENRLFTSSDGYTLTISFPLAGCQENLDIFGNIDRADVLANKVAFSCMIVSDNFTKAGTLVVVEISNDEVKGQFLEGRSEQNYTTTFDDIYIDALDLGAPTTTNASAISPEKAWNCDGDMTAVALPWMNKAYPLVANNWVKHKGWDGMTDLGFEWHEDVKRLSFMPYLIEITKRICVAVGYDYDFSQWEQSYLKYLIICNVLPASWDCHAFNAILPHWSVKEFFDKLEQFLAAYFDFDYLEKKISMRFFRSIQQSAPSVSLRDVTDDFSATITTSDNKCTYMPSKRVLYKSKSHELAEFYSCDWIFDVIPAEQIIVYDTLDELIEKNKKREIRTANGFLQNIIYGEDIPGGRNLETTKSRLLYAKDYETYFVLQAVDVESMNIINLPQGFYRTRYFQKYVLRPVNVFGAGMPERDDIETEELEFVPACVVDTYISDNDDMGLMVQVDISADNSLDAAEGGSRPDKPWEHEDAQSEVVQTGVCAKILAGENSSAAGYFDDISVGFWNYYAPMMYENRLHPCPFIDKITMRRDWSYNASIYEMRRNGNGILSPKSFLPAIDETHKASFKWLGDKIPDPLSTFIIRGKKYLCEKITATLTENGMSQLIKGDFYPVDD